MLSTLNPASAGGGLEGTKQEVKTMTKYTDKELRREAMHAVKQAPKKAKMRAKFLGYSIIVGENVPCPTLVAYGQAYEQGYTRLFAVHIAL